MKKIILLGWLLPLLLLTSGCEKEEDNTPLESVFQTQWKGIFTSENRVEDVIVVFDFPTTGYFIIDDLQGNIRYTQNEKMLIMRSYTDSPSEIGYILTGNWTITKLTRSRLVLVKDPFNPTQKCVLDLRFVKL